MQTVLSFRRIKYFFLFSLLLLATTTTTYSQGVQKPVAKEVTYNTDGSVQTVRYGYQEYLPKGYDTNPSETWPVIIHMVGIGERGDGSIEELDTIAGIGIPRLIEQASSAPFRDGDDFPFLVMSPQPTGDQSIPLGADNPGEFNVDTLANFVDYIIENYRVDPNRVYITAFSAAAVFAARYVAANIDKIAAFVPISGNLKSFNVGNNFCNLGTIPTWAFHNNLDPTIDVEGSILYKQHLNECEPAPAFPPKLTVYDNSGPAHDAWTRTFNLRGRAIIEGTDPYDISIYDWFLQYSKDANLIASAGEDQTIFLPESSVIIEGTSTPSSNVAYQWTQIGNTPSQATLSGQTTATLTASGLVRGDYQFELTATNNSTSDKDTVNVYVRSFSASAGNDTTVAVSSAEVPLTGTLINDSNDESQTFSYSWRQILGGDIDDASISNDPVVIENSNTTNATASFDTAGTYRFEFIITDNIGAKARDTIDVTAVGIDESLTVDAGADTTLTITSLSESITLSGSAVVTETGSSEGLVYQWAQISGPEATLENAETSDLTVANLVKGEYSFVLAASKEQSEGTATDTVMLTVTTSNALLTADAGGDNTIIIPATDSLDLIGSGADSLNAVTGYSWTKLEGPDVELINADSSTLTITQLNKGIYSFVLSVANDNEGTATDTVQVTVNASNEFLMADAGADTTINLPADSVTLTGMGTDSLNEITDYMWIQVDGPEVTMTQTDSSELMLTQLNKGVYSFSLTVTNENDAQASDTVQVTVLSTNDSLMANAGKDISIVLPKESVTFAGAGYDPYNEITSYSWEQIEGDALTMSDTEIDSLTVSGFEVGTYSFVLTVTNDFDGTASDTVTLTVNEAAEHDIELVDIVSPSQDGFPYFSEQNVVLQVKNNGNVDIEGFTVALQVNNQDTITEEASAVVAVGETIEYTMSNLADLSGFGNYTIKASVSIEEDSNLDNNSASVSLEWLDVINDENYSEDFENGDGGWQTVSNGDGWQLGQDPVSGSDNGTTAWFTNLDGTYPANDTSYLVSPVFDFSNATTDPVISFDLYYDIDPSDVLSISVSTDGGITWTTISATDTEGGWTGSSDGWTTVSQVLEGVAGEDNVMVRIEFVSDGEGEGTGAGIDNIAVCQSAPTLAAINNKTVLLTDLPLEVPLTLSNGDVNNVTFTAYSDNQEVIADEAIEIMTVDGEALLSITGDILGEANITVVAEENCSSSVTFKVSVVDEITGIEDQLEDVAVVYPNPSNGIFYIDWKDIKPTDAEIRIFDVNGALIKLMPTSQIKTGFIVDLSTRATGTYMMIISSGGKSRTYRLIKY